MTPKAAEEQLCPNWVYSNSSNVHVAKNRGWFTTYVPFDSIVGQIYTADMMPVAGIGTVVLHAKKHPKRTGKAAHSTITLTNVLHAPTSICNILGGCVQDFKYGFSTRAPFEGANGMLIEDNGRCIAYFDDKARLFELKLSGPPVGPVLGPSAFKPNASYMINAVWPEVERTRFEASLGSESKTPIAYVGDAPYTAEEKAWLKDGWGGEFKFLRLYQLKITDEDDRAEGRAIARAFIKAEREGKATDDRQLEPEDSEDEDSDGEWDAEGHMADYHFAEDELAWIEKHYRNSEQFLASYGFKFYDDDGCRDAKAMVRGILDGDED